MNHTLSPVGEVRLGIGGIDRPDGVGARLRGRRKMACILVVVTSGDHYAQTRVDSSGDSVVESLGVGTPQGQIRNLSTNVSATRILACQGEAHRFRKPAVIPGIRHSPLNALDDAGSGPRAGIAEHLDGDEVALFGNTILCSPDGSGNVGSVADLVCV